MVDEQALLEDANMSEMEIQRVISNILKNSITGPSLFVRASWNEGCSGKIYDEQAKDYVTPDQMFERIMR